MEFAARVCVQYRPMGDLLETMTACHDHRSACCYNPTGDRPQVTSGCIDDVHVPTAQLPQDSYRGHGGKEQAVETVVEPRTYVLKAEDLHLMT